MLYFGLHVRCVFNNIKMCQQILLKVPNMTFLENRPGGSGCDACGRTDGNNEGDLDPDS
jgi:hypothetical protein